MRAKAINDNLLLVVAVILWAAHLVAVLWPEARLWGFNHLIFLPGIFLYIYAIAGIIVLLLFSPLGRGWDCRIYEIFAERLFERRFGVKLLVLSFIALAVFWLARMPTNLLGDGYNLIYSLIGEKPVIVKWSEVGAIKFIYYVSRLLPYSGTALGRNSYVLVSILAGGASFIIFGRLAYELGQNNVKRFFFLCLLLFSAWMLLFFGYVEHYPLLWPFISGYLYFSIRHLQGKGGLLPASLLLAAALTIHLQVLFFLISYVVLIFSQGKLAAYYRKSRTYFLITLILVIVAGSILFLWRYSQSIAFQLFFVPLFSRPAVPYYSLFSPSHLIDMVNEIILLVPLFPILLIAGWKTIRNDSLDRIDRFLGSFSLGGLLLLFAIEPKLGMGRDWDLFALSGLGSVLFMARRLLATACPAGKKLCRLNLLALILIFPFFATNLTHDPSVEYYKWLLKLDQPRSRSGMVLLNQYYTDIGEAAKADSVLNEIVGQFPIIRLGKQIERLTEMKRFPEALVLADSMFKLDPFSVESYNMRGWVYLSMGLYSQAAKDLEQSLRIAQYDHRIFCNLGMAYYQMGQYIKMMETYRRAQSLYPNFLPAIEGLATGFMATGQYDSALVYARRGLEIDSLYATGYEVAGVASFLKKNYRDAEVYLERFIQVSSDNDRIARAENLLAELKKNR